MFYFHSYLGKIAILTTIFQLVCSTTNQFICYYLGKSWNASLISPMSSSAFNSDDHCSCWNNFSAPISYLYIKHFGNMGCFPYQLVIAGFLPSTIISQNFIRSASRLCWCLLIHMEVAPLGFVSRKETMTSTTSNFGGAALANFCSYIPCTVYIYMIFFVFFSGWL